MIAFIILLATAALLALCACMIRVKKTNRMISGFNMMTEEQQRNVDVEKMGKTISNCLFACAGAVAAGGICFYLEYDLAGIILILLVMPFSFISVSLSQKYDRNEKQKKRSRALTTGSAVFVVIVLAAVFIMLYTGSLNPEFTVADGVLSVSGMYAESFSLTDVKSVELKDGIPGNLIKTNGFDLNTILKGRFKSDGKALTLFVDTSKPPFIYLDAGDELIILNCGSEAETQKLYEELESGI